MKLLVLYHAGCTDGFAAAYCAYKRFGNEAEYRAVNYGDDPPTDDLHERDVYILDFSYLPELIDKLAEEAATITLLDHHKSAFERFTEAWGGSRVHRSSSTGAAHEWLWGAAHVRVDLDRSGAQMAWDYFGAGKDARPWFIDYVADRDLWRWRLPKSREVNAYLRSLPLEFAAWASLPYPTALASDEAVAVTVGHLGGAILQSQAREIERAVRRAHRLNSITIPASFPEAHDAVVLGRPMIVNVTENVSEVLEQLAKEPPYWAIGWHQNAEGRYLYSLRASPEGPDVSTIARAFGGGGHAKAAGFDMDYLLF